MEVAKKKSLYKYLKKQAENAAGRGMLRRNTPTIDFSLAFVLTPMVLPFRES
jgi:hypothetical protein